MKTETILAWHFTADKLRDGQSIPPVGEWLKHDGDVVMCESGLHASIDPFDALQYAPGSILHRVELHGEIKKGDDKVVASERRIIKSINIERELRLFACDCVRKTPIGDGKYVWDLLTDERSRNAVVVAEKFANGEATEKELAAAWDAALAAAWDAGGSSAWAAAWAADRDAAGAARDAAWAARDAGAWQREWFNKLINEMFDVK